MKITIRREGGFAYVPGLARPVEIDLARLTAEEQGRLRSLARTAALRCGGTRPSATHPDDMRYVVTVDSDGKSVALDRQAFETAGEAVLFERLLDLFREQIGGPAP